MSGSLEWLSNRSYAVEDAFNQQCGQEIHRVYLKSADDVLYAYTPTNMLHVVPVYTPTNMLHALPSTAAACNMLVCLHHAIPFDGSWAEATTAH